MKRHLPCLRTVSVKPYGQRSQADFGSIHTSPDPSEADGIASKTLTSFYDRRLGEPFVAALSPGEIRRVNRKRSSVRRAAFGNTSSISFPAAPAVRQPPHSPAAPPRRFQSISWSPNAKDQPLQHALVAEGAAAYGKPPSRYCEGGDQD